MRRKTTLLLAALNAALVCLLAWLWIDPQGGLRAVHWRPPEAIRPELGAGSAAVAVRGDADVSRFMAILDRPIFSTTRRPPPPKALAAARADPLDTVRLYGLFSGAAGGGVIIQVEGKVRRVKVSESVGNWTLKEIRGREVVFSRGAESRVVPLTLAKPSAMSYAPPPPIAAAPPAAAPPVPAPASPPGSAAATAAAKPASSSKQPPAFVIGGSSR